MDQKNKIPTKINSKYLLNEWNPQIKSILTKITKTSFMTFNSCCFNFVHFLVTEHLENPILAFFHAD